MSYNEVLKTKPLVFQEQAKIDEETQEIFRKLNIQFEETKYEGIPKYLGLSNEWTSYYVGASWLTDKQAIVVVPKPISEDLNIKTDFIEMYISALKFAPSADYFSKFYGIDFSKPSIYSDVLNEQLTPLLIVHYLSCLKPIISHGLKKDYVIREENLQSKIKGRILLQNNLQKNIFTQRYDKVFCKFQEYTVDNPENRLLKKALTFSLNFLKSLASISYHKSLNELIVQINQMKASFYQVSDEIKFNEIKSLRKNKLFKDYSNAIKLARMILQRFDYSISKSDCIQKSVPPFWIDMSRLYEVYVYSKLEEAYPGQIKFQVSGHSKSAVDFIHVRDGLILDTKYKVRYQNSNRAIMDDVREISGYARDKMILNHFDKSIRHSVIPCVIIYPVIKKMEIEEGMSENEREEILKQDGLFSDFSEGKTLKELLTSKHKIPGFEEFYKLSVALPIRK